MKEVLLVLQAKLEDLVTINPKRAAEIADICIEAGYFKHFESIWNAIFSLLIKSKFLEEFFDRYEQKHYKEMKQLKTDLNKQMKEFLA